MEVQRAEEHNERKDKDWDKNKNNDETRRLRRLQLMMSMVMSVISQDPDLTLEEAAEMAANARRAALSMFPDKELAYDLIYRPRLQRLMNERFRLQ
jgi:CRISPR/Cas system-associated protein Csm6